MGYAPKNITPKGFSGVAYYGVFVPQIGSVVLDMRRAVDPIKFNRLIYNMPSTGIRQQFVERSQNLRKAQGDRPVELPPPGGVPAGFELVPYRDLKDHPKAKAVRIIGGVMWIGALSDEGEFVPDPELPPFPRPDMIQRTLSFRPPDLTAAHTRMYYTLPIGGGSEGKPVTAKSENVYEYRSGRIIKRVLHDTGTFVPEVGSKVLDFKDYPVNESGPAGLRVYNLPGVLRKITKPVPPK